MTLNLIVLPPPSMPLVYLHTWTTFSRACFCFPFSLSSEKWSISVAQAALEIAVLLCLSLLNARIIGLCYCAQLYRVLYGII